MGSLYSMAPTWQEFFCVLGHDFPVFFDLREERVF